MSIEDAKEVICITLIIILSIICAGLGVYSYCLKNTMDDYYEEIVELQQDNSDLLENCDNGKRNTLQKIKFSK